MSKIQIKVELSICNEYNKDSYREERPIYDDERMKEDRRWEEERRHDA